MQRRIVVSLGIMVCIFVIIILLMGCDKESIEMKAGCIGIVETADNYKYSGISWYDNNLNYKGSNKVPIPNMTSTVNKTIKIDNKLYMISNDVNKTSTKSKVVIVDLESAEKYNVYNSSRYINDMAVDENLYTISCEYLGINLSFIDKIGDKNRKIASLKIEGVVLSKIYSYKGMLYASGFGYDDNDKLFSKLYIIDSKSMSIIMTLDMSKKAVDVTDMYVYDEVLYIGSRTKANSNGEEVENKFLISMELDTYKIKDIYIGDIVGQFIIGNQSSIDKRIIFSNYDAVFDEGNKIYSLDIKSRKVSKMEVEDKVRDVIVDKEYMYIMGEKYLCQYEYSKKNVYGRKSNRLIKQDDFGRESNKLIKKVELKKIFKNKSSISSCFLRN